MCYLLSRVIFQVPYFLDKNLGQQKPPEETETQQTPVTFHIFNTFVTQLFQIKLCHDMTVTHSTLHNIFVYVTYEWK